MQKENNLTVGQWCDRWFTTNRHKWNGNTERGYRNLIYSHIIPGIGSTALSALTEQTVMDFYNSLRSQGLSARSVWCVHLLLRRCMDDAAREQLIPHNPVRLCHEPKAEKHKTAPLRLGQIQRYLNAAEQLGVLPLIYGWSVGSFSQVNMFTSETINPSNSPDEMFELYSVPNFGAGVPEIIHGKEIGASKQYVCENDVLVCKINPRINRVWITGHITPYRLLGSSEWIVFRNIWPQSKRGGLQATTHGQG